MATGLLSNTDWKRRALRRFSAASVACSMAREAVTANASSARRVAGPGRWPSRGTSTDIIPMCRPVG